MSKKNFLFVILMVVSWAFYFVLCKMCITISGSPFVAGLFLRIITFVFLSIYWWNMKEKIRIRKDPLILIILIGTIVFLFDAFVNIGFQYASVSIGTVLLKTEILFVLLISLVFLKIKIDKWNYIFIALMLFGVVLCVDIQSLDLQFNGYNFLFIVSAGLNAGCAFAIKNIQEKFAINSFAVAYINNIVSFVLYAVCTFFLGREQIKCLFTEMNRIWFVMGIFLLCSICQTCLMITYYRNLEMLPVWVVKTSLLFVPALSMIIDIFFLKTTINLVALLGVLLVLLGGLGITINSKNI